MFEKCGCKDCETTWSRFKNWLDEIPEGISTMILLALFVAGMWAAFAISKMVEGVR